MTNVLTPRAAEREPCPSVDDPAALAERHADLLGDESKLRVERIAAAYFPERPAQVADAFLRIAQAGQTAVLSGGRTGIAGGATPVGADAVVSFARMNRLLALGEDGEGWYVRAEAGVTLAELEEALRKKKWPERLEATEEEREAARRFVADPDLQLWLPVDPTETSAELGGAAAANASGARTFRHGPFRAWVRGLVVVLADGRRLDLRRGEIVADGLHLRLARADGGVDDIPLPDVRLPRTKHTLGYNIRPGMDAVDLFVGSEGTLGAIVELTLRLVPRPRERLGLAAFAPDEASALSLAAAAKAAALPLEALEYFDPGTLRLLREKHAEDGPAGVVPDFPSAGEAAVYFELAADTDDEIAAAVETLEPLLAAHGVAEDATWAATDMAELDRQKAFRHAAPEAVNTLIAKRRAACPGLHKVGTDMAVPDAALADMFAVYRAGLRTVGVPAAVFGHLGNNHVHVNLLPRDLDELARAKALYADWAREAVRLGGAVAAEHGIGRLKRDFLAIQFPPETLEAFRRLRRAFDPTGMLNPGVLV